MSSDRRRVVIVVTNPLSHRRVMHSGFLDAALDRYDVEIWRADVQADSEADEPRPGLRVVPFPLDPATPGRITRYMNRINEIAWDYRLGLPSKLEAYRLSYRFHTPWRFRVLRPFAWMVARMGLSGLWERRVRRRLDRESRSPWARTRLETERPDALVLTWPHSPKEQAIGRTAAALGIPVAGQILSFDNLTTKGRLHVPFAQMQVWSERMTADLHQVHADLSDVPVLTVGAPQFDPFFDETLHVDRAAFLQPLGLDPAEPVVLFTLGSPRFIEELPGALRTVDALLADELGPTTQLIIRPHPMHDYGPALAAAAERSPRVAVQSTSTTGAHVTRRNQDRAQIAEWINTFRNVDVVVNLASSTSLDAALVDKAVVNIDFDPTGTGRQARLIDSINNRWPHFAPINRSGGLRVTRSFDELFAEIRAYLADPARDAAARRQMCVDVLGPLDGRAGARTADAVAALLR